MGARRNVRLKHSHTEVNYSKDTILELGRCAVDQIYFIRNYVYIKHPKRGRIKFDLYDYQESLVHSYVENRFNIVLSSRQTGKTETTCAFLLWSALFKPDQSILIASNKSKSAMDIIKKIQYAYEELPDWLKPGIDDTTWNKHECGFDNKSVITATTTSVDSGRGMAISLLYCDEFAFVKPHVARQFYDSILPTISTGGSMIISSTPNGDVGQFAELWRGAKSGLNEFKDGMTYIPWDAPPDRDDSFKQKFISLLGIRKWRQEFGCEFLTEELTLIDSDVIAREEKRIVEVTAANDIIKFTANDGKFKFFKRIIKDATYIVGVDPCTGNGQDNGVIQIFEFPSMEQVLEYATNTLSPQVMYTELKSLLNFLGEHTQEVYFSIENNGIGQGILAAYEGDLFPPEAMLVSEKGKVGVNSNRKTKLRSCIKFKESFERGSIRLNSIDLLTELKSFIRSEGSYAAQVGATDDRIMGVIIVFYVIQEMSQTNSNAYDIIYTVASEIERRHRWNGENDDNTSTAIDMRQETTNRDISRSGTLTNALNTLRTSDKYRYA